MKILVNFPDCIKAAILLLTRRYIKPLHANEYFLGSRFRGNDNKGHRNNKDNVPKTSKLPHLNAFSLIEIAMSLIILGIIAGLTVPSLITTYRLHQQKITAGHRDQVVGALAAYVLQNQYLPAPAESISGISLSECGKSDKCIGFVPYKTLGLPEKIAKDGYGHWFTFAVQPSLTQSGLSDSLKEKRFCTVYKNVISVHDIHTNKTVIANRLDPVAFVLISHGPEGRGALTDSGNRIPAVGPEARNAQNELSFVEGTAPDFSHQLYWITRNNFMAIHAKSPCMPSISSNKPSRNLDGVHGFDGGTL